MSNVGKPYANRDAKPSRGKQFWTVENLTSPSMLLTVSTVCLCALGLIMVFSASSIEAVEAGRAAWGEFFSQARYMAVSIVACLIVRAPGGSLWLDKWLIPLWCAVVALLIAVLAVGNESHGATRWIQLGGFSLQPSEFAKIAIVMGAARSFASWRRGEITGTRCLAWLGVFVLIPFIFIVFQKDLGTILIVGASVFLMAIVAGVETRYLLMMGALAVAAVLFLVFGAGYRSARIGIWFDTFTMSFQPPSDAYYGDGWQPMHGLYAVASGGFFGMGLGSSRQKYSYLPEAENDYIFTIICEELGFIGAFTVIVLFVLWGISGMRIAYQARERDLTASFLAHGLSTLVLAQVLLNIGGVLGVLPLSGRPLPFISAGGSSIMASLLMVGLLLGIARDNEIWQFDTSHPRGGQRRASRAHLTVLDGRSDPGVAQGSVGGAPSGRQPRSTRTQRSPRTDAYANPFSYGDVYPDPYAPPGSDDPYRTSGQAPAPDGYRSDRSDRAERSDRADRPAGTSRGSGTSRSTRTERGRR